MCGIFGAVSAKRTLSVDDIEKSLQSIRHRGPDASGIYISDCGRFGLGHRRLSILDLSEKANQPMLSPSHRATLVYNGEVYNYRELSPMLVNTQLRTTSDSEVLLALYEQDGPHFVESLNGMFALGIFDKHDENIYLCRDRLGIKPLFYFLDQDIFLFGSEIKAIEQYPGIKKRLTLNKEAVDHFLHLGYVSEPHTIWNEIKKFPAGSFATIDRHFRLNFKRYWQLDQQYRAFEELDLETAKSQLMDLLQRSVDYRLISDVPVGTFLSGGIDSSLVTALAAKAHPRIKTFNIGFEDAKFDERKYAESVAKTLGTDHHSYVLKEQDALDQVERLVSIYDEPFADSSSISTLLVSEIARKDVTVILTGDGGDELFHGYGSYRWASRLNTGFRRRIAGLLAPAMHLGKDRFRRIGDLLKIKGEPDFRSHIFSQEQYYFSQSEIKSLGGTGRLSYSSYGGSRKLSASELQAHFDLQHYLKDDLLAKVDRSSMKFGLECRVPFLDHHFVEFAINLPPRFKDAKGEMKYLLKEALKSFFPAEMFARPKWGFGIPLAGWLQKDLHYLIDDHLNQKNIEEFGIVYYKPVNELLGQFQSGSYRYYNKVWQLINLHQWAKNHL